MPGISGIFGSLSPPKAVTKTVAVTVPRDVSTTHSPASPSQCAASSSQLKACRSSVPDCSAVRRRYSWISDPGEYNLDQSGLAAKENEYRCDGTSQAAPG